MTARQVAIAAPEASVQVEGRSAPRLPASAVPSITGVRLSPHGSEATLLNISASGILVECTGRLRLGMAVTTIFEGGFSPSTIEGRVARSSVANVSKKGVLQYHIGIAFNSPIALEQAPAAASRQPDATVSAPTATPQVQIATPQAQVATPQAQVATPQAQVATRPAQVATRPAQVATPVPPLVTNRW